MRAIDAANNVPSVYRVNPLIVHGETHSVKANERHEHREGRCDTSHAMNRRKQRRKGPSEYLAHHSSIDDRGIIGRLDYVVGPVFNTAVSEKLNERILGCSIRVLEMVAVTIESLDRPLARLRHNVRVAVEKVPPVFSEVVDDGIIAAEGDNMYHKLTIRSGVWERRRVTTNAINPVLDKGPRPFHLATADFRILLVITSGRSLVWSGDCHSFWRRI